MLFALPPLEIVAFCPEHPEGVQDKIFLAVKVSFSVEKAALCCSYSGTLKGLIKLETHLVLSLFSNF